MKARKKLPVYAERIMMKEYIYDIKLPNGNQIKFNNPFQCHMPNVNILDTTGMTVTKKGQEIPLEKKYESMSAFMKALHFFEPATKKSR